MHPKPGLWEGEDAGLYTASTKPEPSLEGQGGSWVTQPAWAVPTGACIPLTASNVGQGEHSTMPTGPSARAEPCR